MGRSYSIQRTVCFLCSGYKKNRGKNRGGELCGERQNGVGGVLFLGGGGGVVVGGVTVGGGGGGGCRYGVPQSREKRVPVNRGFVFTHDE